MKAAGAGADKWMGEEYSEERRAEFGRESGGIAVKSRVARVVAVIGTKYASTMPGAAWVILLSLMTAARGTYRPLILLDQIYFSICSILPISVRRFRFIGRYFLTEINPAGGGGTRISSRANFRY